MPGDAQQPESHPRDRLSRQLGLGDATFIIVASVIGAGIFFTPGRVAELLPHPGWIMAAWVVGGLLSLAGALANAELGAMFPRAGGDYVYLREGIHPLAGFLVGWLSFFVIYAGTIAALAAAFAASVNARIGFGPAGELALAMALVVVVAAINAAGVRWGARANNLTSIVKVAALLAFAVAAVLVGEGDFGRVFAFVERADLAPEGTSYGGASLANFGRAMSPVLFSYLGWNASVYVASEIRAPGRTIPRSLFLGLALCTTLYLAINTVYLYALPMTQLAGVADAGESAALALFGSVGGALVSGFVLISILGTLNAMTLVGPRIAYAMSLDGLFPGRLDRVSANASPVAAIVAQALVAVGILGVLRSFPSALDFTTFAILVATLGDTAALYLLRWRQPRRVRPYRAWGYPWVPGLYGVANLAIAGALAWGSPKECAIGLGLLLAGVPFYVWLRRRAPEAPDPD